MDHSSENRGSGAHDRYAAIKERASKALFDGRLEEALELFEEAHCVAAETGNQRLEDLAFCNLASVSTRLSKGQELVPRLQKLLLRTVDPELAWLSSYNLALAYDRLEKYRQALFYARISLRYAEEIDASLERAESFNQIGNVLCAMNRFTSALEHFQKGEELSTADETDPVHGLILDNIGYCKIVLGDYDEGFRYLFRSLRLLRRSHGDGLYEAEPRLALSFAYLHVGRPVRAIRHGTRALELAEVSGDTRVTKHALLLLGEAYKLAQCRDMASDCFNLLQETFYPGMQEVPDMLLNLDVCKVINLRA